ncbi:MAG: glucose 1-dehydrogenase [Candidatus Pelagadaptatus aseana]|uniref:glucose 1-dehydrogenase n=1 Tax=Candidatus Pelagadaptatus aseana TaxID=3120508 RepID=UPI0039B1FFC4
MRLENKVALITGAGSGIGEAICHRFAAEGATVIATDINFEGASRVAESVKAEGGKAIALQQDVTSESQWQAILETVIADHGKLNILINNAGIVIPGNVEECSLSDWQKTNLVNSDAVFMGTREAIKVMKDREPGSIINISSIEGIIGEPIAAAYNASKGAVRLFTKSAALHCATSGLSIRVNSVHPGFIETPLVANAFADMDAATATAAEERILNSIPMGSMGQPVDIANGCLFLASDESRYMTGAELIMDGGYTAR